MHQLDATRSAGNETGTEAGRAAGSLCFKAGCLAERLERRAPALLEQDLCPSTLPASVLWQVSPSSSFHFSSLVSIVLLFGELESVIKFETWLALSSDATCLFPFGLVWISAHLPLTSSRGPQLSHDSRLGSEAARRAAGPSSLASAELQSAGSG